MSDRIVAVLTATFRRACQCFPREFRRLFGDDMAATFARELRLAAQRGSPALVAYSLRTLVTTVGGGLLERFSRPPRRGRRNTGRTGRGMTSALWMDLRYAARGLVRSPGFTLAAVFTIALGIGANAAIFTMVDGVLLKPLPYPESARLVRIYESTSQLNRFSLSLADYRGVQEYDQSHESLGGMWFGNVTLTGRGDPERLRVGWVTGDLIDVLGIPIAQGRPFETRDHRLDADRVVIVTAAFRDAYFGTDGQVLGEILTMDGELYTVIGVLPAGIRSLAGLRADVWPVMRLDEPSRRGPFFIHAIARLKPGVTGDAAAGNLASVSERIFPIWADTFQDEQARLMAVPLREVIVGDVGRALALMMGAVGLVLLISVANVANLLLARATAREREMALRTSLGATRGRLVRQLLVESILLAVVGGIAGLIVAWVALEVFVNVGPRLPRMDQVALDGRVLAFATCLSVASGIVFGLAPLAHGLAPNLAGALRSGMRGSDSGARHQGLRGALVTAEFALALPLVTGAALLAISLGKLQRVDAGINPDNLVTATVSLPSATYGDATSILGFWNEALPMIEAIAGVQVSALSSGLPPDRPDEINNFDLVDKPVPAGTTQPVAPWLSVSAGYFAAMQIPLLEGRLPDATDTGDTPPVVAVSRHWAERYYPDEDVLGKRLYGGGCVLCGALTVVGVVGDAKYNGMAGADQGAVYQSFTQYTQAFMQLVVRTERPAATMSQVREVLQRLDPQLPLYNVETMHDKLAGSIAQPRYWAFLVAVFAGVGLVLAGVGIYGVLSYFVTRQTKDIGVRMALGADGGTVRRLIVRRGLGQALRGVAIGVLGTLLLKRWLEGLLFEVSAADPRAFLGVAALLLAIAAGACYWPARRATRIDPVRALAAE